MTLDPAMQLIFALGFTLLLVTAGWHKLSDRLRFQGILQGYRLLPAPLVPVAALVLGILEMLLGIAWAAGWQPVLVAIATASLLFVYAAAMAVNIARGRSYIDCGCGFSSVKGVINNENGTQQISMTLVLRNAVLASIALLSIMPATERVLGWVDYIGIALACLTLMLLYGAFNQLTINRNAIDSWRKPHA